MSALALIVSVLVAAAAAASIHLLHERVGRGRETLTQLLQLRLLAEQLNSLEWRTIAEEEVTASTLEVSVALRARARGALDHLESLSFGQRDREALRTAFEQYAGTVDREFALIAEGNLDEAEQLDEELVDPAFAEIARLTDALSAEQTVLAREHELWAELNTSIVMVAAALVIGFLFLLLDRARQEGDRLKAEFISTVSHELRTPLTSLLGGMRLVAAGVTGPLTEESQHTLTIALRNGQRLHGLIDDLLDFELLDGDTLPLEKARLDAADLIREAVEGNAAAVVALGAELMHTPLPTGLLVSGDRRRLLQVLTNLISNAAKWSPPGAEVRVGLTLASGWARFAVSDRGEGIPKHFEPRLFERFSQAETSDSRRQGGSGLGLSITRKIVDRHGGRIEYQSRPGQGTTFVVSLPELGSQKAKG